jgi:ABC-type uncharacterized transport system auxiliary subunit
MRPIAASLALAAAACSVSLPKAPAQSYYDLEYSPEPVACARRWPSPVEVWQLAADAPYDRPDMVVLESKDQVAPSRGHQWVDRPGSLVAARLTRDLNGGGPFPLAVSPGDPQGAPLALTGNLYRFAWDESGGSARAIFEADLVLRRTGDRPEVLFHRRYRLGSPPVAATADASAFARAMSGVVSSFSTQIRRDLCDAAPQ